VLLAQNLAFGAQAAIEACQRLRAAHVEIDAAWLGEMLALHERAPAIQMPLPQQGRINDVQRSNARLRAGIKDASAEENQMLSFMKLERNRNIFLSVGK
jgi:hypothetical protein